MSTNFSIYRLVLLIISIYFIITRTKKFIFKESFQTVLKLLTTFFIWLPMIFLAIYPQKFFLVTRAFGFDEDIRLVIIFGFVIVFILIFRLLSIIEKIEKEITIIIQKIALKKIELNETNKK